MEINEFKTIITSRLESFEKHLEEPTTELDEEEWWDWFEGYVRDFDPNIESKQGKDA